MFKTNVGGIDRILRIGIGAGLLIWFFAAPAAGGWHWTLLVGLVPLLTGLFATCPLYTVFGIRTCPMRRG